MQALVYSLFLSVFSLDALHRYGLVSRHFTWLPELISIVALLIVVAYGARNKTFNLSVGYLVIFVLLTVHIICGIILNSVSTGPLVTGIRTYLKYLPFFFLPIVYEFTPHELKRQLQLLLLIALFQLPVAIYQRFIESAGLLTGDYVRGTVETSGHLSIFLVCAAAMWIAFIFRATTKRPMLAGVVLLLLLFPTTLNETKGTLFLLPIALIAPAFFDRARSGAIKRGLISIVVLSAFLAIFVPVYDHFMSPKWGYGIVDFFTMEGRVEKYLVKADSVDAEKGGKLGSVLIASRELAVDPAKFVFGLGMGNVSESFFGEQYSGDYYDKYGHLGGATIGPLVLEIGWLGVILVLILCFRSFRDAMYVKTNNGIIGSFGLGWMSVLLVLVLAFFYKELIRANTLSYLFWFYSGFVAATAMRMRMQQYARPTDSKQSNMYENSDAPVLMSERT